jgi:RimJ/RimL family protein N-acetyltransferase
MNDRVRIRPVAEADLAVLEKAGFTCEGVLRGLAFQNGRWQDDVLYSVLRHEVAPEAEDPGISTAPGSAPPRR